jgi:hypothetical protein
MISISKQPIELPKKNVVVHNSDEVGDKKKDAVCETRYGYAFDAQNIASSPPGGLFMHNLNKRMKTLYA